MKYEVFKTPVSENPKLLDILIEYRENYPKGRPLYSGKSHDYIISCFGILVKIYETKANIFVEVV